MTAPLISQAMPYARKWAATTPHELIGTDEEYARSWAEACVSTALIRGETVEETVERLWPELITAPAIRKVA